MFRIKAQAAVNFIEELVLSCVGLAELQKSDHSTALAALSMYRVNAYDSELLLWL